MYDILMQELDMSNLFNGFELGFLHHLKVEPSQLRPLSWALVKVFQFWYGTKSNILRFICSLRWSKFTGTQGMASKLGVPSPKEKVVRQLRGFFEVLETQVCIALSLKQVRPWVYLLYPSRPSGAMLRIWKPRFRGYSEFWVYRVARAKPESSLWWWILWYVGFSQWGGACASFSHFWSPRASWFHLRRVYLQHRHELIEKYSYRIKQCN